MDYFDFGLYFSVLGIVCLFGLKSILNCVLLFVVFVEGEMMIINLFDFDDMCVMFDVFGKFGVKFVCDGDICVVIGMCGVFIVKMVDLFFGNVGMVVWLLIVVFVVNGGDYCVYGVLCMYEWLIGDFVDGLCQIGVQIDYELNEGYLLLWIKLVMILVDVLICVCGDVLSQFFIVFLMMLLFVKVKDGWIVVEVDGELILKLYIDIMIWLMVCFGVIVECDGWQCFVVLIGVCYCLLGWIMVEGDVLFVLYFFVVGVFGGGLLWVEGVGCVSIQGDVGFVNVLMQMGVNVMMGDDWIDVCGIGYDYGKFELIDMDFNLIFDVVMIIVVVVLFVNGMSMLCNIVSWCVKEMDCIVVMVIELCKVGVIVEEGFDYFVVMLLVKFMLNVVIDMYDDYWMVMCFLFVSLGGVFVWINDLKCVGKMFFDYFDCFVVFVKV